LPGVAEVPLQQRATSDSRVKRTLYKPLGFVFLGLAILGVLLPLLPGTPFLLLSAWFFARSSEAWHRRLLANEITGPMIRNWEENQCMALQAKLVALVAMLGAGGASVIFAIDQLWLKLLGVGLLAIGSTVVLSIRTCQPDKENRLESTFGLESRNELEERQTRGD
jgi:uncharacterized membrane protein YbaN (DUF454 family)